MFPGAHAAESPGKTAIVMATTGEIVTYGELEARSCRLAHFWHQAGLRRGDHVAVFLENHLRYFEVFWAARRSGLYLTPVNRYLTAEEAAYIVSDCGATSLVSSAGLADVAVDLPPLLSECHLLLMMDGAVAGWLGYENAVAEQPPEPLLAQPCGAVMFYSSGTTGRPKGILPELPERSVDEPDDDTVALAPSFQIDADAVYLSPAPLYHAAPLGFTSMVHTMGGAVVVMEKWDPVLALEFIERHSVTVSQWVPTMFTRMLKLPPEAREAHDLSSHRVAIHAAAPCPVEIKRQMIEWWGPILVEYYGGSEGNGLTFISSEAWLAHPGSVGQAVLGSLHVCDDDGNELAHGEEGLIYFERDEMPFEYHNDPVKTRQAQHPVHESWSALGDVGYLDAEEFLYLTDRKAFMIISGGINIYPQEIEDALVMHPGVADVAVIGVPDEDLGEAVKAVVQPMEGTVTSDELATELLAWLRDRVAHYKVPKSVDFEAQLPRLPTGKLYKRLLRDRYWGKRNSRIV
ncbi:MAG: acyl-CoA synthetase [Acidobacteriota bacterium]|nr:acyl-CoA synthetase [Acidobacteriota bacterium]